MTHTNTAQVAFVVSYGKYPFIRSFIYQFKYKFKIEGTKANVFMYLYLISGLLFTLRALQNVRSSPQTEDRLQPSFQKAYDAVLKRHHNFAIRTVVQVALRACPKRKEFYDRIAQGGTQDKLDSELARWLGGLEMILLRMMDFYAMGGHGDI